MCEVALEEQERDISDLDPQENSSVADEGLMLVVSHRRVRPPFSVVLATVLYVAELITAAALCGMYHKTNDVIWMSFTITFMLVPALLIQLTLTFIHRDLGRDRPLVLFLHLLLLGPVVRWVPGCDRRRCCTFGRVRAIGHFTPPFKNYLKLAKTETTFKKRCSL